MTAPGPVPIWSLPLGSKSELRLVLDSFNGRPRADLRTWTDYAAGPVPTRGPTRKGVSIAIGDLPALATAMRDAESTARDLGLLPHPDIKTE